MITKAIVEEIVSPYQAKVRIPVIDRAQHSSLSASTEDLNVATICTLPNCYLNIQVGDIVFVGFEDNTYYKAVILGHLCRKDAYDSYADAILGNLVVKSSAELPAETSIGTVSKLELAALQGIRDNIQKQLDSLKEQQDRILSVLSSNT